MALGTDTATYVHQGPGFLYLNTAAPATGARHLIGSDGTPTQPAWAAGTAVTAGQQIVDSNGNIQEVTTAGTTASPTAPTWATTPPGTTTTDNTVTWTLRSLGPAYTFAGATDGATEVDTGATIEETGADQVTLGIDGVITKEAESISVTMKESDMTKLQLLVPHASYASGTDTGLPSGAQAYAQINFGGLPPLGLPKYGVLLISKRKDQLKKFIVSQLYYCYQKTATKLPFSRLKETTYKVDFQALADVHRPTQDQAGIIYWQT